MLISCRTTFFFVSFCVFIYRYTLISQQKYLYFVNWPVVLKNPGLSLLEVRTRMLVKMILWNVSVFMYGYTIYGRSSFLANHSSLFGKYVMRQASGEKSATFIFMQRIHFKFTLFFFFHQSTICVFMYGYYFHVIALCLSTYTFQIYTVLFFWSTVCVSAVQCIKQAIENFLKLIFFHFWMFINLAELWWRWNGFIHAKNDHFFKQKGFFFLNYST